VEGDETLTEATRGFTKV